MLVHNESLIKKGKTNMANYFTDMNTEDFNQETLDKMNHDMKIWMNENAHLKNNAEYDDLFKNACEKIINKYC